MMRWLRQPLPCATDMPVLMAILRRFNSYNRQHPTYKALIELGKAEKTIFLPGWLSSLEARQETNAGLNVVECWNGATEFVCLRKPW